MRLVIIASLLVMHCLKCNPQEYNRALRRKISCGDGICQNNLPARETCTSCPEDCCLPPQEGSQASIDSTRAMPSGQPSTSTVPSLAPSGEPSTSTNPTILPSFSPSGEPSLLPTLDYVSSKPSPNPSTIIPSVSPSSTPGGGILKFLVMGDVPYTDLEACLLPYEMEKLTTKDGTFLVHLGDIKTGKLDPATNEPFVCPESMFRDLSNTLALAPMTVFAVPGDNGWLDCRNEAQAYIWWEDYLFNMNERSNTSWPQFPATVHRWTSFPDSVKRTTHRPELFSFVLQGNILLVGLSLPGPKGNRAVIEWEPRDDLIRDNLEWLQQNLEEYANVVEAVVLFAHSVRFNVGFARQLPKIARNHGRLPILVVSDGHSFSEEFSYLGLSNMMKVTTDDTVTPMSITVDASSNSISNVFTFNRRCPCSTGHNPTRSITHDTGECAGQCSFEHNQCRNEDSCDPGIKRNPRC